MTIVWLKPSPKSFERWPKTQLSTRKSTKKQWWTPLELDPCVKWWQWREKEAQRRWNWMLDKTQPQSWRVCGGSLLSRYAMESVVRDFISISHVKLISESIQIKYNILRFWWWCVTLGGSTGDSRDYYSPIACEIDQKVMVLHFAWSWHTVSLLHHNEYYIGVYLFWQRGYKLCYIILTLYAVYNIIRHVYISNIMGYETATSKPYMVTNKYSRINLSYKTYNIMYVCKLRNTRVQYIGIMHVCMHACMYVCTLYVSVCIVYIQKHLATAIGAGLCLGVIAESQTSYYHIFIYTGSYHINYCNRCNGHRRFCYI